MDSIFDSSDRARLPIATYRLQLNRSFGFSAAQHVLPYLHALGISDCYISSYLKAVPGSLHGYDMADPTSLNPEVGTEEEYRAFINELRLRGMGQILDVVANHMGIGKSCNAWWLDVLENGPSSPYSAFFDIDWHPVKPELENKVLLPILGDLYGVVLENQEIRLIYEEGSFFITYYDHKLPVAPRASIRIMSHRLDTFLESSDSTDPSVQELQSIITALNYLPLRTEQNGQRVIERYREKEIIKKRIAALVKESPTVASYLDENLRQFNGIKGDPKSFDLLDQLLDDQAYRLAYWRVAAEEINYRRFFDINELAAIRMENPVVFEKVHQLIFRLLREDGVSGLRIDHVDGLYDPGDYLQKLQRWARENLPAEKVRERPLYLIVEKILAHEESVPPEWPVDGTTGYDFLNLVNGLFIERRNEIAFDDIYARFTGEQVSFEDLVYEKKKLMMEVSMASEINVLGHQLNLLSEKNRRTRDFTLNSLIHAIREIIACFPVYRTYITADPELMTDRDRGYLDFAVTRAKQRNPAVSELVFDFVRDLLLLKYPEGCSDDDRSAQRRFVMKFQQTTSPVMAKGVEDTAFYAYHRLISLNEVGGHPDHFGVDPALFHDRMRARQACWPFALSATSTHDTKRGEDTRARINVLSEMPSAWRRAVSSWSWSNQQKKQLIDEKLAPDPNDEYLLYQTLIGAWPFVIENDEAYDAFCGRIQSYMLKALRESKVHTSWVNPNRKYEGAVEDFIRALLDRRQPNRFLELFLPFQETIAQFGITNSLAQLVVKIAAPGVPDFYQGTEFWDLNLVDPDNRRAVDYQRYSSLLELLTAEEAGGPEDLIRDLVKNRADGRIKLYVTRVALHYRSAKPALFQRGEYLPLEISGERQEHLIAFSRRSNEGEVIAVVPRFISHLVPNSNTLPLGDEIWGDTGLAFSSATGTAGYKNLFTGEVVSVTTIGGRPVLPIGQLFRTFPVAVLEKVTTATKRPGSSGFPRSFISSFKK